MRGTRHISSVWRLHVVRCACGVGQAMQRAQYESRGARLKQSQDQVTELRLQVPAGGFYLSSSNSAHAGPAHHAR